MKIRKSFVAVLAALVSMPGISETATVDGLLWQYSVSEGKATIEKLLTPGVENVVIPSEIGDAKVTIIGDEAFNGYVSIRSVVVPEGVSIIGEGSFSGCHKLLDVKLPSTLKRIERWAFFGCPLRYARIPFGIEFVGTEALDSGRPGILTVEGSAVEAGNELSFYAFGHVEFLEHVPLKLLDTRIFSPSASRNVLISYPKKYAEEWSAVVPQEKFAGYVPENKCEVSVMSKMRANALTIMDVKVTPVSLKSEVNIRPVAFLNGVNSFANVVKVKTFVDGTESIVQNPIKANQENVFSWNVAADLTDKVAKLKMDVMCVEDEVIPLELVSIPASSGHKAMTISRNIISPMRIRDALMWLLASPTAGIQVKVARIPDDYKYKLLYQLKRGDDVIYGSSRYEEATDGPYTDLKMVRDGCDDLSVCEVLSVKRFVLEELGYTILEGDDLEYARKMTGLKLENGPYVKMK